MSTALQAGTQVVATDTNTGRSVTGTVDATGNYTILGLSPSTYTITVEGRDAQQTTLLVGQTGDRRLRPGARRAPGGAIVVTGRRVREVRTQTVSTNITPAQIENLPQNKRNFLSFAALAPGVQVTPGDNAQVQAGALASQFVNVLLDGMSFKNPINHGGVFGQNFGLGNPFPQIAIQEYSVETQNFGAETGQAGSARDHRDHQDRRQRVPRLGLHRVPAEELHHQAVLRQEDQVRKPTTTASSSAARSAGRSFRASCIFYVAAEGTNQLRPTSTGNVNAVDFPGKPHSQTNVSKAWTSSSGLYFGKLTGYVSDEDTVNLIGYLRREDNLADIGGNAPPSHGRRIRTDQDRYQLQWRHNAGDFLNQLNIAYDKARQDTPSVKPGPEFVLMNPGTTNPDLLRRHLSEAGTSSSRTTIRSRWTIKNDSTLPHGRAYAEVRRAARQA